MNQEYKSSIWEGARSLREIAGFYGILLVFTSLSFLAKIFWPFALLSSPPPYTLDEQELFDREGYVPRQEETPEERRERLTWAAFGFLLMGGALVSMALGGPWELLLGIYGGALIQALHEEVG